MRFDPFHRLVESGIEAQRAKDEVAKAELPSDVEARIIASIERPGELSRESANEAQMAFLVGLAGLVLTNGISIYQIFAGQASSDQ